MPGAHISPSLSILLFVCFFSLYKNPSDMPHFILHVYIWQKCDYKYFLHETHEKNVQILRNDSMVLRVKIHLKIKPQGAEYDLSLMIQTLLQDSKLP